MKIPFYFESDFVNPCMDAIAANKNNLREGNPIVIALSKTDFPDNGHPGKVVLSIDPNDRKFFNVDCTKARFPARIRAAASALRQSGCVGRFQVSHKDGVITISP